MARKQSMMGCSKYEFNPEQIDIDIIENQRKRTEKKALIKSNLINVLHNDPSNMRDTWKLIIESLGEIKKEFNL